MPEPACAHMAMCVCVCACVRACVFTCIHTHSVAELLWLDWGLCCSLIITCGTQRSSLQLSADVSFAAA